MINAPNEAIIWRDEKIAALEAQVDECEREIDHWKVQAHSYKPAWDQMKSENLTLEAQVKTLRDALNSAAPVINCLDVYGRYLPVKYLIADALAVTEQK